MSEDASSLTVAEPAVDEPAVDEPAVDDLAALLTAPEAAPVEVAPVVEATQTVAAAPMASEAAAESDDFANSPVRTWRDNTGTFEVTGRLVVVMPDKVRLLKENGRFTTVPMRRLSDTDRQYVEQTVAKKNGQPAKFISVK